MLGIERQSQGESYCSRDDKVKTWARCEQGRKDTSRPESEACGASSWQRWDGQGRGQARDVGGGRRDDMGRVDEEAKRRETRDERRRTRDERRKTRDERRDDGTRRRDDETRPGFRRSTKRQEKKKKKRKKKREDKRADKVDAKTITGWVYPGRSETRSRPGRAQGTTLMGGGSHWAEERASPKASKPGSLPVRGGFLQPGGRPGRGPTCNAGLATGTGLWAGRMRDEILIVGLFGVFCGTPFLLSSFLFFSSVFLFCPFPAFPCLPRILVARTDRRLPCRRKAHRPRGGVKWQRAEATGRSGQ